MQIEPWLPRAAALRPGSIAVEAPGGRLAYRELLDRASRGAGALAARGIGPGARVALTAESDLGFVVSLHACLLAGAVVVPIDPRLPAAERERRRAGAPLLAHSDFEGGALASPVSRSAEDPALVVHTSGTTGMAREVVISHGNILAIALGSAVALGLDPAERWLCPLPLAHIGGLMVLLRSSIYATTAMLMAAPLDPVDVARRLRDGVTVASLVPTLLRRILAADSSPPRDLRVILLGGAAADPELLRRAAEADHPVAQTYGLTESCSQATVSAPGDVDSCGRALPGVSVSIAADGEIVVAGPTVATPGGVLHTGDLGRLDAAGRLRVLGRRDEMIVTGGENVAPAEVEAVLLQHPAVVDAAVFGRTDAEWGQAVTAAVVLAAGAEVASLRAFCRERLAPFQVPKAIEAVAALPRTPSGKLLRRKLS